MDKKNHSGGNGFNVFVFGIIIGVLATLLLTTKKGRKLLKVIIEEGTDRLSKWEDVVDTLKTQYEEDNTEDDEPIVGEEVPQIEEKKKVVEPEPEPVVVSEEELEPEAVSVKEMEEEEDEPTPLKKRLENEDDEPPLHAAVLEKKETEQEPTSKKKSRLFKGIRRKAS